MTRRRVARRVVQWRRKRSAHLRRRPYPYYRTADRNIRIARRSSVADIRTAIEVLGICISWRWEKLEEITPAGGSGFRDRIIFRRRLRL
jgi:hypothetical protein